MLYALISLKPGLRVPLICVVLADKSRVARWAWQ
jgi:hypothetical protein